MGDLIQGDDGLIAEEVHDWVKRKHELLCYYLDTAKMVRKKPVVRDKKPVSTYIDVFCGTGRALIKETGEWVDGSPLAAWRSSVASESPFTRMYIADIEPPRRDACAERLASAGAPFEVIEGDAIAASKAIAKRLDPYGYHFALVDPFGLADLDFHIIAALSRLKRMDMMIHLSALGLNRNAWQHVGEDKGFDRLAPGWREHVHLPASSWKLREGVVNYWRTKVASLGKWPSPLMKLITVDNKRLYWLALASGSDLAHRFWKDAVESEHKQGSWDF
jgi:three-Cys-motif partner protein